MTALITSQDVDRSMISPNPGQPRKRFDQAALEELADSIRQYGILQPIVVRPDAAADHDGAYVIIAGERRWRAAGIAGLAVIPCRILHDLTDKEAYRLSMVENINRADMTIIEEAKGYAELAALGDTVEEIAGTFGKEPWYVEWRIGLLALRDDLQELVARKHLDLNFARNLSRLSLAGQADVMAKYNAGQFASAAVANKYALLKIDQEAQVDMFAAPVQDELALAVQGKARKAAKEAVAQLANPKLTAAIAAFLESSPAALAAALGPDVAVYGRQFEALAAQVGKVRSMLAEANAIHLANQ